MARLQEAIQKRQHAARQNLLVKGIPLVEAYQRRIMPWVGRNPAWDEAVAWVQFHEARFARRGGVISAVRMSKPTWMRLCDVREMRYAREKKDKAFGKPGERHYNTKKLLNHPLYFDPDMPRGWIWVDGN